MWSVETQCIASLRKYTVNQQARYAAEQDEQDGTGFEFEGGDEHHGEDGDADEKLQRVGGVGAERFGGDHQQGGGGNQAHHGHAEHGQGGGHHGVLPVPHQQVADNEHHDDGQQDGGEGGGQCAEDARPFRVARVDHGGVARVGGGVDAHGTGCDLRGGHNVGELLRGQPALFLHHVVLDEGNGGQSSAETEDADLQEGEKQPQENHDAASFLLVR